LVRQKCPKLTKSEQRPPFCEMSAGIGTRERNRHKTRGSNKGHSPTWV